MQEMIVDVDRLEDSIVVSFADGVVVRYAASLLRAMISLAEVLPHPEPYDAQA